MQSNRVFLVLGWLLGLSVQGVIAQENRVAFEVRKNRVELTVDERAVATYVLEDDKILRPYFAHVRAPSGVQVTRNHPPQEADRDDHATMHPGVWIAFGDINGHDFWRNRGRVEHVSFSRAPASAGNSGSFTEMKRYLAEDGTVVCDEEFRFAIRAESDAYLLMFESIFTSPHPFYFGDQEEMGLGIRVATPISELKQGRLRDATGRVGAGQIWSQSALWCDYAGSADGDSVGATIFCHPSNFRESWFHARDYGLLVANPFGKAAMKKGETSKVMIQPGESIRLRYGVWIHDGIDPSRTDAAYDQYVMLAQEGRETK